MGVMRAMVSFEREAVAPGWTKVTIVAPQPVPLADYKCEGLEARIRILKYVFASTAGACAQCGLPQLANALRAAEQHIMEMFDEERG